MRPSRPKVIKKISIFLEPSSEPHLPQVRIPGSEQNTSRGRFCGGQTANLARDGYAAERIVQNLLDKIENEQHNERILRLDRQSGTQVDHCRMPVSEPAGAIERKN